MWTCIFSHASPLDGRTCFLFFIFYFLLWKIGVTTYFYLFFEGKKKKNKALTPKEVYISF